MRPPLALPLAALALALATPGCLHPPGEDRFAYLSKPLYNDRWNAQEGIAERGFHVTDGSIARLAVAINFSITDGEAAVSLKTPTGTTALSTRSSLERMLGYEPGRWLFVFEPTTGAHGHVQILVTRA